MYILFRISPERGDPCPKEMWTRSLPESLDFQALVVMTDIWRVLSLYCSIRGFLELELICLVIFPSELFRKHYSLETLKTYLQTRTDSHEASGSGGFGRA